MVVWDTIKVPLTLVICFLKMEDIINLLWFLVDQDQGKKLIITSLALLTQYSLKPWTYVYKIWSSNSDLAIRDLSNLVSLSININAPFLSYPTVPNHSYCGFFSSLDPRHRTVFQFLLRPDEKDYISITQMSVTTLMTSLLNHKSYRNARAGLPNFGITNLQVRWFLYFLKTLFIYF